MISAVRKLVGAGVLGAVLAAEPIGAMAAGLNPSSNVRGAMVRLSDLFTGLEAGQDCEIGPAPAPGHSIVVAGAQLSAIAAQFGVDWTANGAARATITRLGRTLPQAAIEPVVREAAVAAGAPEDGHLELGPYTSPMVALDVAITPSVQQIDYDSRSGRLAVTMLIVAAQGEPQTLRLIGRMTREIELPVLVHDIAAGSVLSAADFKVMKVSDKVFHDDDDAPSIAAVAGLEAKRALGAGQPVRMKDTQRHQVVRRGGAVHVSVIADGLILGATFQAMQGGSEGDDIRLVNPGSGAIVVGHINADGSADVAPGSMPIGNAKAWQMPRADGSGTGFYEARNGTGL